MEVEFKDFFVSQFVSEESSHTRPEIIAIFSCPIEASGFRVEEKPDYFPLPHDLFDIVPILQADEIIKKLKKAEMVVLDHFIEVDVLEVDIGKKDFLMGEV